MQAKDLKYITGGYELIDQIKPLWESLNKHHVEVSPYFAGFYQEYMFAERKKIFEREQLVKIYVEIVCDSKEGTPLGYCIASIDKNHAGEIESIYIVQHHRREGIGHQLITHSLGWLDAEKVQSKSVAVTYGNEQAFAFYERYGFYPRFTMLKQKN